MDAFKQVAEEIPEARELMEPMAECEGKEDVPLAGTTAGLQALVELLLKNGTIRPEQWAEALAAHR
ncbi:MAG: hypothetical protein ABR915_04625 [Thermoguttaceae bacterium]|jgi:hypothetical protein